MQHPHRIIQHLTVYMQCLLEVPNADVRMTLTRTKAEHLLTRGHHPDQILLDRQGQTSGSILVEIRRQIGIRRGGQTE